MLCILLLSYLWSQQSRPDDAATTATPSAATDNNIDNEDSLNLTIGEDEAKLFQGDVSKL